MSNREELDFLRSYLELFHFRFDKRIEYSFLIEKEVYHYATIKHILQPILENSLVHGVFENENDNSLIHITVGGMVKDENVIFTIEDDGRGIEEERLQEIRERLRTGEAAKDSIGIYNVANRLQIVYGTDAYLKIESEIHKGTKTTISIRALRKGELEQYVQNIDC